MKNSSFPSFFDEDETNLFRFAKPEIKHQKDLNKPTNIRNWATCNSSAPLFKGQGLFALHGTIVVCYNDEGYPQAVLDVAYSRLQVHSMPEKGPDEQPIYGLSVMRNQNCVDLYFNDTYSIEVWVKALKDVCIMTNFHEEYKGLQVLAEGKHTKQYLVNSKTTKKRYAVKAFLKDSHSPSENAISREMLKNEINMLRSLNHDSVIKLHEVQETERTIYLVMDYIPSQSLQEVLRQPNWKSFFSQNQFIRLVHSILDALVYLASQGVVHRNLSPESILIEKAGKIKIIDFRLATTFDSIKPNIKQYGPAGYIAPEEFDVHASHVSSLCDDRCDVFSFGCILFYLLFGQPLCNASNSQKLIEVNKGLSDKKIFSILMDTMSKMNNKIDKEVLNLLLELLQCDPNKRISAEDAYSHNYFTPVLNDRMVTCSGAKDVTFRASTGFSTSRATSQDKYLSLSNVKSAELSSSQHLSTEGSIVLGETRPHTGRKGISCTLKRSTGNLITPVKSGHVYSMSRFSNPVSQNASGKNSFSEEPPKLGLGRHQRNSSLGESLSEMSKKIFSSLKNALTKSNKSSEAKGKVVTFEVRSPEVKETSSAFTSPRKQLPLRRMNNIRSFNHIKDEFDFGKNLMTETQPDTAPIMAEKPKGKVPLRKFISQRRLVASHNNSISNSNIKHW